MDMQSAPPTYTPTGGASHPTGNPPVLGAQVPGMTGGLPSQGGLSVLANPMAQQLQSYGRGDDSMLVHMTPREVNSLQGLAMAAGGSLTTNPHTGLPEAGWLGDLLPMIVGAIATPLTGGIINPLTASAIMGVGTAAVTGDLSKGLMAGLQTYGGAALGATAGLGAGSFGIGSAATGAMALPGAATGAMTLPGAATGALTGAAAPASIAGTGSLSSALAGGVPASLTGAAQAVPSAISAGAGAFSPAMAAATPASLAGATQAMPGAMAAGAAPAGMGATGGLGAAMNPAAATKFAPTIGGGQVLNPSANVLKNFGQQARNMLPSGTPGMIAKNAPMIAGAGVLSGLSQATQPRFDAPEEEKSTYAGPYSYAPREVSYPDIAPEVSRDSSEHKYFSRSQLLDAAGNPAFGAGPATGGISPSLQSILSKLQKPAKYAGGGEVNMARGSFVADARTVSELGNGSSGAGQELLARLGGRPLRGPGDGVSDSIPARIGSDQPARVARDEVLFSPEAVRRIGKGSEKRGAQKLYALMEKAQKARKKAKRGQDTGLRKGLA